MKEQVTTTGNVAFKPMQRDLLTGELSAKKPKSGNGRHIRLKGDGPAITPGMAYFAGTGPKGKYCKDCRFLGDLPVRGRKGFARYESEACEEAARMSEGRVQRGGLGANRACKYFKKIV